MNATALGLLAGAAFLAFRSGRKQKASKNADSVIVTWEPGGETVISNIEDAPALVDVVYPAGFRVSAGLPAEGNIRVAERTPTRTTLALDRILAPGEVQSAYIGKVEDSDPFAEPEQKHTIVFAGDASPTVKPGDAVVVLQFRHAGFEGEILKTPFPPGFKWEIKPTSELEDFVAESDFGFVDSVEKGVDAAKQAAAAQGFF